MREVFDLASSLWRCHFHHGNPDLARYHLLRAV